MALIAIRADASASIGTGHVMRCLTLAGMLRERGAAVAFLCRAQPGDLCGLIEQRGYGVRRIGGADAEEDAQQTAHAIRALERRPDWLIVDHYAFDRRWESALRALVGRIMVVDDLANRPHDCDLILDQNYGENLSSRYEHLVPRQCIRLIGPRFALLRREFREARRALRQRTGKLARLLIAFGGSDPTNETEKTLTGLAALEFHDAEIDVVLGGLNPHRETVRSNHGSNRRISFHESTADLAALMSSADLSIGAGGAMNWERCFLGLPAVVIVTATNQAETSNALGAAGAIINLGWHADVSAHRIATTVASLSQDGAALRRLGRKSMEMMDSGASTPAGVDILATLMGTTT